MYSQMASCCHNITTAFDRVCVVLDSQSGQRLALRFVLDTRVDSISAEQKAEGMSLADVDVRTFIHDVNIRRSVSAQHIRTKC